MGRLTQAEADAALQAMQPDMRAVVQVIKDTPYAGRAIAFARACHQHQWPRAWADHVHDVCHPAAVPSGVSGTDYDDDIPF